MHRRVFIAASASLLAAPNPLRAADPAPFDGATVRALARQLASQPYKAPPSDLTAAYKDLDVTAWSNISYDPAKSLWAGQGRKFTARFVHRGYIYPDRVEVFEVADGRAAPVRFNADQFTYGTLPPATTDLGFAGFKIQYPLNHPDAPDEVCAFLGASYFRAVAKGQGYGLSARGLAIKTADAGGEEFPVFRAFWLERPALGADILVIHALLDSPSAAASFRFTIRPGEETAFDTEAAIYPRTDITQAGLAPLTSMFLFDASDRMRFDDARAAVHDSNGLQLRTGHDQAIFRALANPVDLQVSAFADTGPRGFGLVQRNRALADYQDIAAAYEKRPSLWVEPIGDWGQGVVELVEIPSIQEVNDNMVAFWRPAEKLAAKGEYLLSYRLHWCWSAPIATPLAQVMQTRCGASPGTKLRRFVIDFVGDALKPLTPQAPPSLDAGADKGKIVNAAAQPNPDTNGWRVTLDVDPQGNKLIELRARLTEADKPLTETWMYRWTPG